MSSQYNDERRRSPRILRNIPIKICQENGDIVTESGNISRSGIYCCVDRYIEPMTKIKVQLLLPVAKENKVSSKKILFQGVVVRTEETTKENIYNLAIFFNDISLKDSKSISEYITDCLELPVSKHAA